MSVNLHNVVDSVAMRKLQSAIITAAGDAPALRKPSARQWGTGGGECRRFGNFALRAEKV